MLDPLTVLGVIANVTQFIDFTIKIFTNSRNIHHSTGGSLAEDEDLNIVTRDISVLSRKLRESLTMTDTSASLTADEQTICNLCKGCIDVSQELTKALENLKGQGKPGRFRSFRQALKSVWSRDDIDSLVGRVKMYKEELNIRTIVALQFVTRLVLVVRSDTIRQEQD